MIFIYLIKLNIENSCFDFFIGLIYLDLSDYLDCHNNTLLFIFTVRLVIIFSVNFYNRTIISDNQNAVVKQNHLNNSDVVNPYYSESFTTLQSPK